MKKIRSIWEIIKTLSELPAVTSGIVVLISWILSWSDKSGVFLESSVYLPVAYFFGGIFSAYTTPKLFARYRLKYYCRNAPKYWDELKSIVRDFHQDHGSDKKKLNLRYQSLRRIFNTLCVHFGTEVIGEITNQQSNHPNRAPISFKEFKMTLYASILEDWRKHCQRNFRNELDCFDQYPIFFQKVADKTKM